MMPEMILVACAFLSEQNASQTVHIYPKDLHLTGHLSAKSERNPIPSLHQSPAFDIIPTNTILSGCFFENALTNFMTVIQVCITSENNQ